MKVRALFGDESALMDRILVLRTNLKKSSEPLAEGDALRKTIMDFDARVDAVRKQIVATTEVAQLRAKSVCANTPTSSTARFLVMKANQAITRLPTLKPSSGSWGMSRKSSSN